MRTKENDVIEIDYVGFTLADTRVFDFTDLTIIDKNSDQKVPTKIIKLGKADLLPGLDVQLINKEIGKTYDLIVPHTQAFGKRDPKRTKLISLAEFKKHNVEPQVGMQIDLDGTIARVKTVSGGRVILDFNHPLAGKDLGYKVRINKKVTELKDQIQGYVHLAIPDATISLKDKAVTITCSKEIDSRMKPIIEKNLKQRFPALTTVKIATKS